jgi:hypothetical protein
LYNAGRLFECRSPYPAAGQRLKALARIANPAAMSCGGMMETLALLPLLGAAGARRNGPMSNHGQFKPLSTSLTKRGPPGRPLRCWPGPMRSSASSNISLGAVRVAIDGAPGDGWRISRAPDTLIRSYPIQNLTKASAAARLRHDGVEAERPAQPMRTDFLPELWIPLAELR